LKLRHKQNTCNMKKNIFTKVENALSPCFEGVEGHTKDRIDTLCSMITGLLLRKKVDMDSIGQGFLQDIKPDSRRVHCKRFLENEYVNYETFYYPYICTILQQLFLNTKSKKQLLLTIDGTCIGSKHTTLTVSFLFEGTSIPLCWVTREAPKGHFLEDQHIALIEKCANLLNPILPADWSVVLLGDGEFDGANLQILCQKKLAWDYVLRTNCNTYLYENGDPFQPQQLSVENGAHLFIEDVAFAKDQKINTNFILWHQKELYQDAIPLVTTFDDPMTATILYALRYSIERLFKGVKSSGFNVDQTRLTKIKSIDNLLICVFLAYILMICFAKANDGSAIKAKIVRIRKETVLSSIVFALRILMYCIENSIDFMLSFQISKNFIAFENSE
jgi:hypothetical protein